MRTFIAKTARAEEGFVLVLALVTLLLLTLFGVWALNTSDFETRVAAHTQQTDRVFNLNEGANYAELSKVVHGRRSWIDPGNIYKLDMPLLPTGSNKQTDFDPFRAAGQQYARSGRKGTPAGQAVSIDNPTLADAEGQDEKTIMRETQYWIWDNLELAYKSDDPERIPKRNYHESDYRYLVTYARCDDISPIGDDSGSGDSGRHEQHVNLYRIQASGYGQNGVVESAGSVVGPGECK